MSGNRYPPFLRARPPRSIRRSEPSLHLLKVIMQIIYELLPIFPSPQFYIPKVPENKDKLVTHGKLRNYSLGLRGLSREELDACRSVRDEERIFHWFLEFPEIMDRGGFDCILGNPPYLGGQALSGTYGHAFCEYMKWQFSPTGLSELVVYFLRRIHTLLKDGGFAAIITTNSIIDGEVRKDGLEQVLAAGAQINMAVRGMKWPGAANLVVSLLAFHNGKWSCLRTLDNPTGQADQRIL